jgi:hypothetical protein
MFDSDFSIKLGISLSRRLEKSIPGSNANKFSSKNNSVKLQLSRDTFEAGVVILKCILGGIFDEIMMLF